VEDALAKSARGDDSAFEEVVRRHQAMVYSLARHFLGDPSAAEEVAQDVFFQLHRNLGSIKSGSHLTFWLRKVTAHRSIDRARRRRPDPPLSLEEVPEPAAPASRPDSGREGAPDPAVTERLQLLVRALPEKRRMVVVLRYQEELELHEIAELLDMPINTVKSCLQRSLAMLREKLTRCFGDVPV
jgi:RNA polymerase sigma-70 factor, ECF subfamily